MRKRDDIKLADMLLAGHAPSGPPRLAMLNAKRFTFDAGASAFFGTILAKTARLVLREHEFARQPYPQTWVEIDARSYAVANAGRLINPGSADDTFGFLYNNGVIRGAAYSSHYRKAAWGPWQIHLHQPISFEQELALAEQCQHSRLTLRYALLGTVEPITDDWWQSGEADAVVRSHRFEFLGNLPPHLNANIVNSASGVLKQVLAILLMLTKPGQRVLNINEEPRGRTLWKGKNLLLVDHHTVKLPLKLETAIRRFITGIHTGLHRRHHDVRGHWAQTRRLQVSCTHVWDPVDVDHYRCLRCEAKRWWRKDHQRGRLEQGTVTKDYQVTE